MELMNSWENRHGEYLKCVIASRVIRDGLNFKNIKFIHLIGPEFNPSSMYQAISRGIRTASHKDLLDELVKQQFDPKLDIQVYLHAALPNKKIFDTNGVDVHIYEIAYLKQLSINNMMTKLKQCSIGCQIHYKRNVRPQDLIKYECVDPSYTTIDYSTYNAYFLDDDVLRYYPQIVQLLSTLTYFNIEQLLMLLPQHTRELLLTILEYIILNKIQITNQFGYITYLYYADGYFYLNKNYNDQSSLSSIIYEQNLIAINNQIDEFVDKINVNEFDQFIKLEDKNDIENTFNKLSIDNQIIFLENEFINQNPKYLFLLDQHKDLFYTLKEIKEGDTTLKQPKKGRPLKKEKNYCLSSVKRTDKDVLVNILNLYKDTNEHNIINFYISANTTMRIYGDNGWRNATECENVIYKQDIEEINTNRFLQAKFKFNGLFGININNKLRIVYNTKMDQKEELSKTGGLKRDEPKGKKCGSYNVDELAEIAKKLKIKNYESMTRDKLCPVVEKVLIDTNRMF
jgi:hypothetical protein